MTEEQTNGLIGLGNRIVGALPGPFLALLSVNIVVVGGMIWLASAQTAARERVMTQMLTACLDKR